MNDEKQRTNPDFRGNRMPVNRGKSADGGRKVGAGGAHGGYRPQRPMQGGEKGAPNGRTTAYRGKSNANGAPHREMSGEKRSYSGNSGRPGAPRRFDRRPTPARKSAPVVEGLPARRVALSVLRDVTENGAYASLSLDKHLTGSGLNPADRRLAARLAYDTIERLLTLDHALAQVMAKPDTDIKLRNVLRLGACQILLEDRIPDSAATNTAVALCKEIGMEGLAGVCNGILRSLVRQKDALRWPDEAAEPVKARAVRYSTPEWLVARLTADWGEETADALMKPGQQAGYVTVRPNMTRLDDAAFDALLDKKVWQKEPGLVPHARRISGMADVARDADFLAGQFSIQGESSMLACMAVAPRRGTQVLDACAAPGGKACLLAEMMGGTGRVQAWELHEHRTALIAAQARRLGLENIRPITRDASKHREELDGTMDAVLLDAPCSGLGVMADKPDVKYRVTEESVAELTTLQARLLDAVAPYVKEGGTLVYSTCSVLKAENVAQVESFLARHPEFERVPLPESIPAELRAREAVGLQLMPHLDGVGGFYICRMRRKRS